MCGWTSGNVNGETEIILPPTLVHENRSIKVRIISTSITKNTNYTRFRIKDNVLTDVWD